jgi:hypothetical protein
MSPHTTGGPVMCLCILTDESPDLVAALAGERTATELP